MCNDNEFLTQLTARVNAKLLVTVENNGRKIGLIELNPYVASVVFNPLAYGYVQGVRRRLPGSSRCLICSVCIAKQTC